MKTAYLGFWVSGLLACGSGVPPQPTSTQPDDGIAACGDNLDATVRECRVSAERAFGAITVDAGGVVFVRPDASIESVIGGVTVAGVHHASQHHFFDPDGHLACSAGVYDEDRLNACEFDGLSARSGPGQVQSLAPHHLGWSIAIPAGAAITEAPMFSGEPSVTIQLEGGTFQIREHTRTHPMTLEASLGVQRGENTSLVRARHDGERWITLWSAGSNFQFEASPAPTISCESVNAADFAAIERMVGACMSMQRQP